MNREPIYSLVSKQLTAELLLFATTFIWGSTFIVTKWGLDELSPLLFLALRFSLATALLFLLIARRLSMLRWATIRTGSLLGVLLFLGFALQTIGLRYTTASKSAFITGLMVIFTPLVQYGWQRRAMPAGRQGPTRANLLGIVIVIAGLWLLTAPEGGGLNFGDGLTLLCAIAFAGYIVALDRTSLAHEVLPLTFAQIGSTALFCWLGTGLLESPRFNPTGVGAGVIVYLAVAATVGTGYIMTRYQRDTTPTRAVVIYAIEPVWTALMAAAALGERLGTEGIVGGGLILAGVLVSELSGGATSEPAHASGRGPG